MIQRAAAVRAVETLRFVAPYMDQPALAEQACRSVVELAHHKELRDPNRQEFAAALQKVLATAKDAVVLERAKRYLEAQIACWRTAKSFVERNLFRWVVFFQANGINSVLRRAVFSRLCSSSGHYGRPIEISGDSCYNITCLLCRNTLSWVGLMPPDRAGKPYPSRLRPSGRSPR